MSILMVPHEGTTVIITTGDATTGWFHVESKALGNKCILSINYGSLK